MKEIFDYSVVWEKSLIALEIEVRKQIAKGWQPQGGVFTEGEQHYQTMVKIRYIKQPTELNMEDYTIN